MLIEDPLEWQAHKLAKIYTKYSAAEIYDLLSKMRKDMEEGVPNSTIAEKLAIALGR